MKIIFFSLVGTFDYFQIGGTDSFIRRITKGLLNIKSNIQISWVFYNSREEKEINHSPNFTSKYFKNINNALKYIADITPEHVISCYIKPSDRIKFANFITTNDVAKLNEFQVQYSTMLYQNGGIVDDLLVYNLPDVILLVVNA